MTKIEFLALMVFCAACAGNAALAQTSMSPVLLKNGKPLDLTKVTFPMCTEDECEPNKPVKKLKPKDICIYAKCVPLESAKINEVLPVDAEHWRLFPDNTMQLFKGDNPLLSSKVAAAAPLVKAEKVIVGESPVLVQTDKNGQVLKYWVRVSK
jgi:hypothetical protein